MKWASINLTKVGVPLSDRLVELIHVVEFSAANDLRTWIED